MSVLDAITNRFANALEVFADQDRLVEYDDTGAIVLVNGEETLISKAALVTAAQMSGRDLDASGWHRDWEWDKITVPEEKSDVQVLVEALDAASQAWEEEAQADWPEPVQVECVGEPTIARRPDPEEHGVPCHMCGEYFIPDPDDMQAWGESGRSFDPTDWTCDACYEAEQAAIQRQAEELFDALAEDIEAEVAPEGEWGDVTEESALLDQVCEKHAAQLVGWEEVWCPICQGLDDLANRYNHAVAGQVAVANVWAGVYSAAFCVEANKIAGDQPEPTEQLTERTKTMNFHTCTVTGKHTWAGQDGFCKRCRGVEAVAEILDTTVEEVNEAPRAEVIHTPEGEIRLSPEEVQEINAPMLADLIEEVGGETALLVSIEVIRRAKRTGKRGDAVNGRRTRELLNLIMRQPHAYQGALLSEYREFLAPYGIGLNVDVDGVWFHDYHALTQPVLTGMEDAILSHDQRHYAWQANAAEKRAMRNAFVETVRTARNIVMSWVSSDGTESGSAMLGPNTEETRLMAAEYQAAGRRKGYRTHFTLVQA
jgi:hypothetical protein